MKIWNLWNLPCEHLLSPDGCPMHQLSLLNNFSRAQLNIDPFPHIVIREALDPTIYNELEQSFPDNILLSESTKVLNDRGHTRRLLYNDFIDSRLVSPLWQEFAKLHTDIKFFRFITTFLFQNPISEYYPSLVEPLDRYPVNLRTNNPKKDKNCFVTDFQFVSNLPVSNFHTSRTPHLDNPKEIYACLFYMKQNNDLSIGGGLNLYKPKNSAMSAIHSSQREVALDHLSYQKTVPYEKNTLVVFLNTRNSYHGVQNIFDQSKTRRSINIIGELPFGSSLFSL